MKIETPKKSKVVRNYVLGKFKLFQEHKATLAYKYFWGSQELGPPEAESILQGVSIACYVSPVLAILACLSVHLSVCLSHAGIE